MLYYQVKQNIQTEWKAGDGFGEILKAAEVDIWIGIETLPYFYYRETGISVCFENLH